MNNDVNITTQEHINNSLLKIRKQYLANDNNIPWLIGYSGGKDSTCTAQLVFKTLLDLKKEKKPLNRNVYIFTSDTMIENPLVQAIVSENIGLINKSAKENGLPIEALILQPEIDRTFWVNIIGRGYPTPNTMFRWCTDRLKIEPANNFVHRCIDKNGEVIMVLGVREGESDTRDRVLKTHSVEGETLMRHTTLPNAYVFPPIKNLTTIDVFTYLAAYDSPWNGNNKRLFAFYEEAGGGECPVFVSQQDKTSSNACGNSRLGCWVCTVVAKDKSLSGFIDTGYHDELKPLLEFRNWLTGIRDIDKYRCHYRNNGSVYLKGIEKKNDNEGFYLSIPKKGAKDKIIIRLKENGFLNCKDDEFIYLSDKDKLSEFMKKNNYTFESPELGRLILRDKITNEYFKLGTGPFTKEARALILEKLLDAEKSYCDATGTAIQLITDAELAEIKKFWLKDGMDITWFDTTIGQYRNNEIKIVLESFEVLNKKYESTLKNSLEKLNLDYQVANKLIIAEKNNLANPDKENMLKVIESIFSEDKNNY